MQKTINKPIVFLPLMILLIITSLSANKTMFPAAAGLTSEIKATAIQFQNLKGSNRISDFQKLYSVLFKQPATAAAENDGANKTSIEYSFEDIEKILGAPDAVLSNTNWVYYLNANQENCKAIISIDKTLHTCYCTLTVFN